jgi:site-specific recombinase XerC
LENGQSPLPARAEENSLVIPFKESARCPSRSAVHDAIKGVFISTPQRDSKRQPQYQDRAAVEPASAHWLRQAAGPHMVDQGLDLRTIRDNLERASLTTTNVYVRRCKP